LTAAFRLRSKSTNVLAEFGVWNVELERPETHPVGLERHRLRDSFTRRWTAGPRREQLALLAHELRHAVEIGREPGARDVTTVTSLFRRIGHETSDRVFETLAAQETESAVRDELGSSMPPTPTRATGR